jgi:hypothetical protein
MGLHGLLQGQLYLLPFNYSIMTELRKSHFPDLNVVNLWGIMKQDHFKNVSRTLGALQIENRFILEITKRKLHLEFRSM